MEKIMQENKIKTADSNFKFKGIYTFGR